MNREWFQKVLEDKNIGQNKLAEQVEVSPPYISMIISGERNPSVDLAKKIAAVVDIEWTLFFD